MRSANPLLIIAVAVAFFAIAGASLAGAYKAGSSASGLVTVIPAAFQAAIALPDVRVLDVRTPQEYAAGHIAGATNIDFYASDFAARIGSLDKNVSYAIYCHTGNRSAQTLTLMQRLGFTHATNLQGGIAAWEAAGYTITTS